MTLTSKASTLASILLKGRAGPRRGCENSAWRLSRTAAVRLFGDQAVARWSKAVLRVLGRSSNREGEATCEGRRGEGGTEETGGG